MLPPTNNAIKSSPNKHLTYTPSIDLFVEIAAFFDVTLDHLIMGKSLSDQEESLRNKLQQKRLANQKLRLKLQRIVQNLSAIAEEL